MAKKMTVEFIIGDEKSDERFLEEQILDFAQNAGGINILRFGNSQNLTAKDEELAEGLGILGN
jgi:hypothetical protein